MMIIIITSLMFMSPVVGGDVCSRVFLNGSNFCRHSAYPRLLFVMFVRPLRKMAE